MSEFIKIDDDHFQEIKSETREFHINELLDQRNNTISTFLDAKNKIIELDAKIAELKALGIKTERADQTPTAEVIG